MTGKESNKSSEDESNKEALVRGNVLVRQELRSLTPKCDINCAIIFNVFLIVLFATFGIPILTMAHQIVEFRFEYTDCHNDEEDICTKTLNINHTIPGPVYFYYELHNFYVNHRDFVNSRSFPQLKGNVHVDSSNNSKCEGAKFVEEIFDNDTSKYYTHTGLPLKGGDYANPCGLIAKSFFNDSDYQLFNSENKNITIDDTDIANDYDRNFMFKRHKNHKELQWIDVESQHFIVWMQMESFQNFRKLWGKISSELKPDNYTIRVKNNYNVTSFNGRKYMVFSNSSPIGAGIFLGYTLIFGASFCFLVTIILFVLKLKYQNKVYKLHDLKWT